MSWRSAAAIAILASLGVQSGAWAGRPEWVYGASQLDQAPVRPAKEVKAAGALLVTLKHEDSVELGPFSRDGKMLVTRGRENLFLWEVKTAKRLGATDRHYKSAAFSPTGDVLAVIRGGIELKVPDGGYPDSTWGLELLSVPGLRVLLSGATGEKERELYPSSLVFSPDGRTIAGDQREHVILFNARTGRKSRVLKPKAMREKSAGDFYPFMQPSRGIAYSPDGNILAHACINGTVVLWNAEAWKLRATLRPKRPTSALVFSPDGKLLASAGYAPTQDRSLYFGTSWIDVPLPIELWDVRLAKPVRPPVAADEEQYEEPPVMCHTGDALHVSFSSDGKLLATSGSNTLKLWEISTQRTRLTVEFDRPHSCWAVFSPVENTLAVAHQDSVELWDVAKLLQALAESE